MPKNGPGKSWGGIGFAGRIIGDLKLLIMLIRDYATGRYRDVAWGAVITVLLSMVYVLSPLDIMPDWILGWGQLDDAAITWICLYFIEKELVKYGEWKKNHDSNP